MSYVASNQLPDGWAIAPVKDLGKAITGNTPPTKDPANYGGDIPFIKPTELIDRPVSVGRETISDKGAEKARILPIGGVLVSCIGNLGKTAIARRNVAFNQQINAIVFNEAVIPEYGFYYFQTAKFRKDLESLASATTISIVNKSKFESINVPIAPPEQQKRIVAKIEELFSHIDAGIEALKKAKQLLKQYRQSVLKAAVTGELTKDLPCRQAGWRDPSFRNISDKCVPENSPPLPGGRDKYFAYVLECEDGSLYKGYSQDLFARINCHLEGNGAKWTREHRPISLIHFEEFSTEKEAVEREKYFKSGSGREWINDIRNRQNKKHEPASQLLERILKERRQKWEEQQLEQFKAKGKMPKDDKWKDKYKEPFDQYEKSFELPKKWVWATVDQLGEVQLGRQRSPKNRSKEYPTKYIRAANITEEGLDFTDLLDMEFRPDEFERYVMKPDDLVLSEASGSPDQVGKPAIWKQEMPVCCFQNTVIRHRPHAVEPEYLLVHYKYFYWCRVFGKTAGGVGINHLSAQKFLKMSIALPPLLEQKELVRKVYANIVALTRLDTEIEIQLLKAEKNKQSILASAFSGGLIQ